MKATEDLRIAQTRPLISPAALKSEFPMTERSIRTVLESRTAIASILQKRDKRLLAVVGPCSIHDVKASREYAERLAALRKRIEDRIFLIMRVYFEKPRTTVGWRGLIVDPNLDGSYDVALGLRTARSLLLDLTELGVPVGSEMLDPIVPQYIADLISWAAIGARTTESQIHRELASGLSMPVGFKNSTDGNLQSAINAIESTRTPHSFIGIDQSGRTCVLKTLGNPDTHIIFRGGSRGPNYQDHFIEEAERLLAEMEMTPAILVDCSHDNSGKKQARQREVLESVMESVVRQRSSGRDSILGLMIESNLFEGNQKIPADLSKLRYGVSITDECVGWESTEEMLLYAYEKMGEIAREEVEA